MVFCTNTICDGKTQRYAENVRACVIFTALTSWYNAAESLLSQYIQLIAVPIGFTLASFVGIAVTSAGVTLYGQVFWDPLKLIDQWDNRACAFLTSLVFVLSTLSANISANSLSVGNDMAALYPRYLNIRRGQVICAFLGGWALCSWKILARWEHRSFGLYLPILRHW